MKEASQEERIGTMEHPYNSWAWFWSQAVDLEQNEEFTHSVGSLCCFGGRREKWYSLFGNSPEIAAELNAPHCPGHQGLLNYTVRRGEDGRLQFDTEEESEYPWEWCVAYARGLRRAVEAAGRHLEAQINGRKSWVMDELEGSTDRLREETTARILAGEVVRMEQKMVEGKEMEHLKEMLKLLTIRGTEIKLFLQDSEHGELPYPAYRWLFRKAFSLTSTWLNSMPLSLWWKGGRVKLPSTNRGTWQLWTVKSFEVHWAKAEAGHDPSTEACGNAQHCCCSQTATRYWRGPFQTGIGPTGPAENSNDKASSPAFCRVAAEDNSSLPPSPGQVPVLHLQK